MNASEARRAFVDFFVEKGHQELPSSSVIPHGDKTLLFTNAGMNQFKEIFTGREKPQHPRATTAQKCIRAGGKHNDLDNVGYTTRHCTFFEMLGNFSFGDYFKKEAIEFAWELITERFKISPEHLWVTVFREDDEARDLWGKISGLPSKRIVSMGEKDNYWSMGDVGPCGPCSEILVDRGDAFGAADIDNGERFFEIWNLVFMQFDQKPGGEKVALPKPSIDTGMGLERLLMVLQGVDSAFETDILRGLITRVEAITGAPYSSGPEGVPHRVIADHIRALCFAFADGAQPSNEGRGYVLRRILRRAARYGRKISPEETLLAQLVDDVVREMGEAFPELVEHKDFIERLIRNEEARFGETLDNGIQLFEEIATRLREKKQTVVPGDEVFKLYDTFGFPVDLVEQMAEELGFEVDQKGFDTRMRAQKERSRGSSQFEVASTSGEGLELDKLPPTRFVGYDAVGAESEVQRVVRQDDTWRVVLAETPFYAEGGGQVGDTGTLLGDDFALEVLDTKKDQGRFIHNCRLVRGDPDAVSAGVGVRAEVDTLRRRGIERNHTATHLLHAALRQVLGTHVRQKGSLVEMARLRFDVTHFAAVEPEELEKAEDLVRAQILANTPVETFETSYDDAVKHGAMALFGEKYGDVVRVVKIGDFSTELCGGTHTAHTGEVGPFLLTGEGSVSSGVRRLEALTAEGAARWIREREAIVSEVAALLKTNPEGVVERLGRLLKENRDLKKSAKKAGASAAPTKGQVQRAQFGDILFVSAVLDGAKDLRAAYDPFKAEAKELVVAIFAPKGESVRLLVGVSRSLVERGLDARELFRVGGAPLEARGGGRKEMAQGSGAHKPGAIERAVEAVGEVLQGLDGVG